MMPAMPPETHHGLVPGDPAEQHLRVRVAGEFREMPGLVLTLPQASRLFSLDTDRCERVLSALVQRGTLVRRGPVWSVRR